jgi:cytochrome c-type biogenesis protein CcmF
MSTHLNKKTGMPIHETAVILDITVVNKDGRRYPAHPGIALSGESSRFITDTVVSQSLVLRFNKVMDKDAGKMEIGVKESGSITDLITLKVYEFPMINVLWLGVLIMVTGFIMSIVQRVKNSSRGGLRVS